VDYCLRARAQGYQITHVPLARIFHDINLSGQSLSPTVHYYMTRNRLLFLRKHNAGARAWMHTLLNEYARTLISWSIRPKWRDRRILRSAMWQAVCDAFRGKWGKKPAG
jgi:GT2 family glycosyltransferase